MAKATKNSSDGPVYVPPPELVDFESLWIRSDDADPLTTKTLHKIPIGRPKDFFRTVPDPSYRRKAEIYVHKSDNNNDETMYLIGSALRGQIAEAKPFVIVTVVDRLNKPRLYPIRVPDEDGTDYVSWETQRSIAAQAKDKWVRLFYQGHAHGYGSRIAEDGYAPEPDFSQLPTYNELINGGFGPTGVMNIKSHPVYRDLFGLVSPASDDDDIASDALL
jgi:hypothetical protein